MILFYLNFIFVHLVQIYANGIPSATKGSIYGSVYVPGDIMESFDLILTNGSKIEYNYKSSSVGFFPLVIWITNFREDPWSTTSLLSTNSIDAFLNSDFDKSHYLFLSSNEVEEIVILENKIKARCIELNIHQNKFNKLLFANETISSISAISDVLDQWPSFRNFITITYSTNEGLELNQYNITRLDCYWPYCDSAEGLVGSGSFSLIYGGDGCQLNNTNFIHNIDISTIFLLVDITTCSYDEAAFTTYKLGFKGSLIIMKENEETYVQINSEGNYDIDNYVTSISYSDGTGLKSSLLGNNSNNQINITFQYELISGYFLVIDSERKIQQMGCPLNAYMMLASWTGQYEYFRSQLLVNLTKSAMVVPVFNNDFMNVVSDTISLPNHMLSQYNTLEIDTKITCPGNFDGDCSTWDHTATITVSCVDTDTSSTTDSSSSTSTSTTFQSNGNDHHHHRQLEVGGDSMEIARYVTPFSRRVGHWVTDTTSLLPLFLASSCQAFTFDAMVGGGGWIISTNLRLSSVEGKDSPRDYSNLFNLFAYFRPNEVTNQSVIVTIPLNTYKIELQTIISTHGDDSYDCCEFLPTAHFFEFLLPPPPHHRYLSPTLGSWPTTTITTSTPPTPPAISTTTLNNNIYNISFLDAGTTWGCADQSINGAEPNEYGTWWYGRGGWCDGMDVKPIIIDVTSSILLEQQETSVDKNHPPHHQEPQQSSSYATTTEVTVRYDAKMFWNNQWIDPPSDSSTGYVIMSSHLIYYLNEDITPTTTTGSTNIRSSSVHESPTLITSSDRDNKDADLVESLISTTGENEKKKHTSRTPIFDTSLKTLPSHTTPYGKLLLTTNHPMLLLLLFAAVTVIMVIMLITSKRVSRNHDELLTSASSSSCSIHNHRWRSSFYKSEQNEALTDIALSLESTPLLRK